MVEPGAAAHRQALAGTPQRALHGQLRFAQVVAGLGLVRPLARETGVALQQQRLGGAQLQLQLEVLRPAAAGEAPNCVRYRLPPSSSLPLQRPAADAQVGVVHRGPRQRRGLVAGPARDALRVQVRPGGQVGQRGMGKQQVARGEAAVQRFGQAGAAAEEGDLKAEALIAGPTQLAGDVPPLDGGAEVRAVVARKAQRAAAAHAVFDLAGPGQARWQAQRQQRRGQAVAAAHHQSSLTDSSAARDAAARAL